MDPKLASKIDDYVKGRKKFIGVKGIFSTRKAFIEYYLTKILHRIEQGIDPLGEDTISIEKRLFRLEAWIEAHAQQHGFSEMK